MNKLREAADQVKQGYTDGGRNMFYEGLFEGESERQRAIRLRWADDMRAAFERHFGQSWFDKDWYAETGIWSAAWSVVTAPPSKTEQEHVREHDKVDLRCECCGYMTYHREHLGCIRAAVPPSKPDTRLKVKLGRQYGGDLNGHWFYLQPADEYAEQALTKHSGISNPLSKPQDVAVGIDVTELGTHLVARRGNEIIQSEFYHAPKREWVSLSDEAAIKIVRRLGWGQSDFDVSEILEVVRAIDAALKEKNNG